MRRTHIGSVAVILLLLAGFAGASFHHHVNDESSCAACASLSSATGPPMACAGTMPPVLDPGALEAAAAPRTEWRVERPSVPRAPPRLC